MRHGWPAAIVLLAFGLRLLRLAHLGDLEFDEIVSVRYAALPLPLLISRLSGALFEHPPAFYAALGAWQALAGNDDVLVRVFSVLPGTVTVSLTYGLGRRVAGQRVGALAALLVAVAPLTLFYSREARMYALVTCLGVALIWLYLHAMARPRNAWWWCGYTALGALTAYVHYLGALLLVALVVTPWLSRGARHLRRPVGIATAAVFALAAPWALAASGGRASLPALSLANLDQVPAALRAVATQLGAGPDSTGWLALIAGMAYLLLAGIGLLGAGPARSALVLALGSAATGLVFAVALGKPVQARYVLPAVPVLCVCAAAGLVRHARAGWALLGVTAVGAATFWQPYYGGYSRADYSDITRRIAALERPDDVVLLTGPWQAWYFDYYYPRTGGALWHEVLPHDAPPALDPREAAGQLEALVQGKRRLWFVQAGLAQADPTNFVEGWLRQHTWPAVRESHQNAVLQLFSIGDPESRRALQPVTFGESVRLTGGWVDGSDVAAGDVVRCSLELEALTPSPGLKASLRLIGAGGERAAVDFPLEMGSSPGQRVTVRQGILVPPDFGPQPYEVRLVVYNSSTLQPLEPRLPTGAVAPGGEAPAGVVYVTQSLVGTTRQEDSAPAPATFGGDDEFDTIAFRGVRWAQDSPSAGPLSLDLLWQLRGFTGTPHYSDLMVTAADGTVWAQSSRALFGGTFNVRDWRSGETLAERRSLDLTHLPPGHYRVLLGLSNVDGKPLPVDGMLGRVEVATFTLPYQRPLPARARLLWDRVMRRLRPGR